jgi:HPt (histidine-containing phosphotransfer) domain-containing protein
MIKADMEQQKDMFIEHTQVSIANLEDYIAENNIKMIALTANKIAKDAATINLPKIIEIANKLEIAADQKQRMKCLTLFTNLEESLEIEYERESIFV